MARDDGVLDVLVHRRLFRGDEAGPHIHAFCTQGQGGDQTASVGHASGGDEGDRQLVGRAGQQDEVGDVVNSPG